jgi:enoyl-CoA hydratase/carnithine racemase
MNLTTYFYADGVETSLPGIATVSLRIEGHVALISMIDDERHNAMTANHVKSMISAIDSSWQKKARAVVIASGAKNFCAGADVIQLLKGKILEPGHKDINADTPLKLFRKLQDESRPVITAIHGLALGGGVELALSSDLVYSSPDAKFAMPEIGLGLLPRVALARLSEFVGRRRAMELILTRKKFPAEYALNIGLINGIIPLAQLVSTACKLAADIVTAPPSAIAAVKKNLGRVPINNWDAINRLLEDMNPAEWREGLNAFLEKRPPEFDDFWSDSNKMNRN